MRLSKPYRSGAAFLLLLFSICRLYAAPWLLYGPDGGDARSLAVDPSNHAHLYLGTTNGSIYETTDAGTQWKRLARVGNRDDLVLDTILVDASNPTHLTVGAWVLDHADGGIYQSRDAGVTWIRNADMAGQSIRSLAAAPSDPRINVAGTLSGIFRTLDSGEHWKMISPPASTEIHEVQSLAIDPLDPQTIYAGTWHLPWKTTDGGENWAPIKQGVIDDSDVFSIIVDPQNPKIVFASACSGIYKSEDKGERFHKVQGIPSSARRTLVLMQDPQHQNVVFAGTTEGLWRTEDAGANWSRITGPEVIVNDIYIDSTDTQKILLATDRGGVLTSGDGGNTFVTANRGFSARQVTAFVGDSNKLGTIYTGVVNDKQWGGVFLSRDGGLTWAQRSEGLAGRDVFSLAQTADGTLLAGTVHGIFRLEDEVWNRTAGDSPVVEAKNTSPNPRGAAPSRRLVRAAGKRRIVLKGKTQRVREKSSPRNATTRMPVPRSTRITRATGGASIQAKTAIADPPAEPLEPSTSPFDATVHAIVPAGDSVFAITSRGILASDSTGRMWHVIPTAISEEWRFLAASQRSVLVGTPGQMMLSSDAGETWKEVTLPPKLVQITALAVDARGELWAGGREGVFLSSDKGMSWQTLKNLYVRDVNSLYFDPGADRLFVTSNGTATIAFSVEIPTRKVSFWDTGWTLRFVRPVGDHLLGVTLFDGVVIQPQMVEAKGSGGS